MGLKKFSDFKKNESNTKQKEEKQEQQPIRKYKGSASSEYSDDMNKEILAQEFTKKAAIDNTKKPTKKISQIDDDTIKPVKNKDKKVSEKKSWVDLHGKVARFPKDTKASKALNFLENVKISKSNIWYLLIEKMDNELQMVKYNQKEGVNLIQFVNELKKYYITKYSNRKDLVKLFESIELVGEDKFSSIKNIPNLIIDGKTVVSKITEDLTRLLSK